MSSKQPLWLRAVHRLERAVGEPVESAVRSDTYFDVVSKATRVDREGRRAPRRRVARAVCTCSTCRPARTCSRMREQLPRMERRLNQLTENVAELDERAAAADGRWTD